MKTWFIVVMALVLAFVSYSSGAASGFFAAERLGGGDGSGMAWDVAPEETVAIAARDHRFSPDEIAVSKGALTELVLSNEDDSTHTFTYEVRGETFDHRLAPGETKHVLVRFDEAGVIEFRCRPHGGMDGQIDILEA